MLLLCDEASFGVHVPGMGTFPVFFEKIKLIVLDQIRDLNLKNQAVVLGSLQWDPPASVLLKLTVPCQIDTWHEYTKRVLSTVYRK